MQALDQKKTPPMFKPTNVPYVLLGAALLWFGWFGFNGGSALAANDLAVSALVTTNIAAAGAAVSWCSLTGYSKVRPPAMASQPAPRRLLQSRRSSFVTVPSALNLGLAAV
jgi:Amt family ammonium transporter